MDVEAIIAEFDSVAWVVEPCFWEDYICLIAITGRTREGCCCCC